MDVISHKHHQSIAGTQHMCAEQPVLAAKLPGHFRDLGLVSDHNWLCSWHNMSKIANVGVVAQIPGQRPMLRRIYSDADVLLRRVRSRDGFDLADQPEKVAVGMRVDIGIALDGTAGAVVIVVHKTHVDCLIERKHDCCPGYDRGECSQAGLVGFTDDIASHDDQWKDN